MASEKEVTPLPCYVENGITIHRGGCGECPTPANFMEELMNHEPEPDFCVCDYRPRKKCSVHPKAEQVSTPEPQAWMRQLADYEFDMLCVGGWNQAEIAEWKHRRIDMIAKHYAASQSAQKVEVAEPVVPSPENQKDIRKQFEEWGTRRVHQDYDERDPEEEGDTCQD